jgi:hypothetical protein
MQAGNADKQAKKEDRLHGGASRKDKREKVRQRKAGSQTKPCRQNCQAFQMCLQHHAILIDGLLPLIYNSSKEQR